MRVSLVSPSPPGRRGLVNKDVAGGFGTVSEFGRTLVGDLLTRFKQRQVRMPILSLGYVAALFEEAGWTVRYTEDPATATRDDLALVYTSLVAHDAELAAAAHLRRAGTRVGFLGAFASVRPELFVEHGDFVIEGEPEQAVRGLAAGDEPTGIVSSPMVQDLDTLPFPSWSAFDGRRFRHAGYFPGAGPTFPVLASRGCALSCAYYCPYTAVTGRTWRKRSPQNVVAELESLVARFGARHILFRDPIFTLKRERVRELVRLLQEARLGLTWVCETHLDYLDEELIDEMAAMGLRALKVGIESSSEGALDAVHRHQPSSDRVRRLLKHCERIGVGVTAFYMLGLPDDTPASIHQTLRYAIELNTLGAQFTLPTPYPGTPWFDEVEAAGRLTTRDWNRYDVHTPVVEHDHLSPSQLRDLEAQAYQDYYLRPRWAAQFLGHHLRRLVRPAAPPGA